MPHARNLLEQTLARTARIDDRVGFGSPTAGICFNGRLAFGFGFVAAMRHDSYKSIAELRFSQLQKDCRSKVPPATPARENKPPKTPSCTRDGGETPVPARLPKAGICFSERWAFGFGFVAAMRLDSYKSIAISVFPQLCRAVKQIAHAAAGTLSQRPTLRWLTPRSTSGSAVNAKSG